MEGRCTVVLIYFRVGSASSEVYKHYLASGARCVEIDAWNDDKNEEEPKGM